MLPEHKYAEAEIQRKEAEIHNAALAAATAAVRHALSASEVQLHARGTNKVEHVIDAIKSLRKPV